jgi:putative flavoprotein involved in K+ transport
MDTFDKILSGAAESWLSAFGTALSTADTGALASLMYPDSHWRDLLAFTWHISTVSGPDDISTALANSADDLEPQSFSIDYDAAPPRMVMRGGRQDVLETIFRFTTKTGQCSGVLRMIADEADAGRLKAWTGPDRA